MDPSKVCAYEMVACGRDDMDVGTATSLMGIFLRLSSFFMCSFTRPSICKADFTEGSVLHNFGVMARVSKIQNNTRENIISVKYYLKQYVNSIL